MPWPSALSNPVELAGRELEYDIACKLLKHISSYRSSLRSPSIWRMVSSLGGAPVYRVQIAQKAPSSSPPARRSARPLRSTARGELGTDDCAAISSGSSSSSNSPSAASWTTLAIHSQVSQIVSSSSAGTDARCALRSFFRTPRMIR
eukprot:scaffold7346_cov245-Pinguiococcus_pyrenoidosus.AAC.41